MGSMEVCHAGLVSAANSQKADMEAAGARGLDMLSGRFANHGLNGRGKGIGWCLAGV